MADDGMRFNDIAVQFLHLQNILIKQLLTELSKNTMFTGKPCRLETDRDQKGQKTNSTGLHSYNTSLAF